MGMWVALVLLGCCVAWVAFGDAGVDDEEGAYAYLQQSDEEPW